MSSSKRILVVDDEPGVGMIFSKILGEQGHSIYHCSKAEEAFQMVQSDVHPEIIFLDIRLPGIDGVSALPKLLQINPSLRIIMMTAYQTVESVVATMKAGAVDFLVKPLNPQMLIQAVEKYALPLELSAGDQREVKVQEATKSHSAPSLKKFNEGAVPSINSLEEGTTQQSSQGARALPEELHKDSDKWGRSSNLIADTFVAHTPPMKAILSIASQFAASRDTILILGESGTGKELLAHYIHHKSHKKDEPFVVVDCASIPESLFESELFGYEKGAFTGADSSKVGRFELANGGTLFLDEIGNVPLIMQAKLLRFIEDHKVTRLGGKKSVTLNIRLVAATNADLKNAVEKGLFREDLYYRLTGLVIHIPPLRNRPKEEKEYLVQYYLKKNAQKLNKPCPSISEAVRQIIQDYSWPGNVRELQGALHSAALLCNSGVLEVSHLPVGIQSYFNHRQEVPLHSKGEDKTLRKILKKVERDQILSVLKQTGGNKKKASEILGMDYKNFLAKIKEYSQDA